MAPIPEKTPGGIEEEVEEEPLELIEATPEEVGDDVDCSEALQSAYPDEPEERDRMSSWSTDGGGEVCR